MYRGPTVTGRKLGIKSMIWSRRRNKHSTRTEGRNKNSKKEERLRSFQDNLNIPTSESKG